MTFGGYYMETPIFQHFFGISTCPVFSAGEIALLDGYPGIISLDPANGRGVLPITAADFSSSLNSTVVNTTTFRWTAIADWTHNVGGWIIGEPTIDSIWNVPRADFAAGEITPAITMRAGDVIEFPLGSLAIVQDGREPSIRGHFTNYTEDVLLNHIFAKSSYAKPNLHVGLLHDDPTDAGTNIACTEVTAPSYQRINTPSSFWTGAGWPEWGWVCNKLPIQFPLATEEWGAVSYFGIFDTALPSDPTGHLLMYAPLAKTENVALGSRPRFAAASNWWDVGAKQALYFRFSY
ncbi:hypothetical protein LCGC14_0849490 [marine sediment metagenome]|uniref:Uncharacterized protein n=1 Tax=marine sediment metagenome TaxID=412755 RepID=A0A0F9RVI0_9ZZZZ